MKPEIWQGTVLLFDDVVNFTKCLVVVVQQLLIVGRGVVKIVLQISTLN